MLARARNVKYVKPERDPTEPKLRYDSEGKSETRHTRSLVACPCLQWGSQDMCMAAEAPEFSLTLPILTIADTGQGVPSRFPISYGCGRL